MIIWTVEKRRCLRWLRGTLVLLLGVGLGLALAGGLAVAGPRLDCAALAGAGGFGLVEATSGLPEEDGGDNMSPQRKRPTVTSAILVDTAPAHCRVDGFVTTGNKRDGFNRVNFRMLLPPEWNGKMYFQGSEHNSGTGFDGFIPSLVGRLDRGYATVGTDTGHQEISTFASWAQDNPTAVLDWAGRGVHLTNRAARKIIEAYYGTRVRYAYFEGCSGAGGQAMMSAQRYPRDFDGIIASAPTAAWTKITMGGAWNMQRQLPDPANIGQAVLPDAKLPYIGARVYAKCDALDGIVDNILNDPRACPFDPDVDLEICAPGNENAPNCVTAEQRDVYKAFLAGPANDEGQIWPGFPLGGEIFLTPDGYSGWLGTFFADNNIPNAPVETNAQNQFTREFFHHIAYPDNDDGSYDYRDFDFEIDLPSLDPIAAIVDAVDPDLRRFGAHGGRLIIHTGWNDHAVTALGVIDYYERVRDKMGDERAQDVARLFLKPGVIHCGGGSGPDEADFLTALEDWVENSTPPESIVAARMDQAGQVDMTRPLCAYPQVAKLLDPAGSTVDAANFECVDGSQNQEAEED